MGRYQMFSIRKYVEFVGKRVKCEKNGDQVFYRRLCDIPVCGLLWRIFFHRSVEERNILHDVARETCIISSVIVIIASIPGFSLTF